MGHESPNEMMKSTTDECLPPPVISQVRYWHLVCDTVAAHGTAGLRDTEWAAAMHPSRRTLREMVARDLLVRRSGAWHLRRSWRLRLTHLGTMATPTPPIVLTDGSDAPGPSSAECQEWDQVCRWLEAQPGRCARLPFPPLPTLTMASLLTMRKFRLIQHLQDCAWRVSPHWRDRLQALCQDSLIREGEMPLPVELTTGAPTSVAFGIDTWYLNWKAPQGLPAQLLVQLADLQDRAKAEGDEVATPWRFDDMALLMYSSGGASVARQPGWSYILHNASLTIRVRRQPVGEIVLQAQLNSPCLWRLTAHEALNHLDAFLHHVWGVGQGYWQVSQVHIAHDIMNTAITWEQIDQYVSRSRVQMVMEDNTTPAFTDHEYRDDLAATPEAPDAVVMAAPARTLWRRGRHISGIAWSLGRPLALVQYDKAREVQRTGITHMLAIWHAHGRDGTQPVVRYEARLRRGALTSLTIAGCAGGDLDNPWTFLTHLRAVWAYVVGATPSCPDATERAWIRRVVPQVEDTNRSRWPTDPEWRVVQTPACGDAPAPVRHVLRRQQQTADAAQRLQMMYGALISYTALAAQNDEHEDVARALAQATPALLEAAHQRGKPFATLVQERKQRLSLPLAEEDAPVVPAAFVLLPHQPDPTMLDATPADPLAMLRWQMDMAHRRMIAATVIQQAAERRHAAAAALAGCTTEVRHEAAVYAAAVAAYNQMLRSSRDVPPEPL